MNFHPPVILKFGNMNLNLADKWIGHIPQRNFTVRPWTFIPGPKEKGSSGKTMIFHFCHSTFRGLIQISKSRFTKMGWDFQSTLKKKMQGFTLKFHAYIFRSWFTRNKSNDFFWLPFHSNFHFRSLLLFTPLICQIWFLLEPTQSEERLFVKRKHLP